MFEHIVPTLRSGRITSHLIRKCQDCRFLSSSVHRVSNHGGGEEEEERILIRKDLGAVTKLTLNSPKTLNALSDSMLTSLQCELDDISKQKKDIRCVIIAGSGKAFCAGHDLKELIRNKKNGMSAEEERDVSGGGNGGGSDERYFRDLFDRCSQMMLTIRRLPQPVIAQVHGIATAAGCQLVATCDMAVATETTRFGVNGINVGFFCSTPMVALSRNIPPKVALEMLTTGEFIPSKRALEIGLINRVVPNEEELEIVTEEMAKVIAGKFGKAIQMGKEAFYKQLEMPLEHAYDHCVDVAVSNLMCKETRSGIDAFLHKRKPEWNQ